MVIHYSLDKTMRYGLFPAMLRSRLKLAVAVRPQTVAMTMAALLRAKEPKGYVRC